jgi:hypothetical protein
MPIALRSVFIPLRACRDEPEHLPIETEAVARVERHGFGFAVLCDVFVAPRNLRDHVARETPSEAEFAIAVAAIVLQGDGRLEARLTGAHPDRHGNAGAAIVRSAGTRSGVQNDDFEAAPTSTGEKSLLLFLVWSVGLVGARTTPFTTFAVTLVRVIELAIDPRPQRPVLSSIAETLAPGRPADRRAHLL